MADTSARIDGVIEADELIVGEGVVVEAGVLIRGLDGPARKVVLGEHCYVGRETRILAPEFRLGDYSKLNAFSFGHGAHPLQIGRNCWIGGNTVLDSLGGLDIDDNVGIGAHSQIWTHIRFGDVLQGCRFNGNKYMHIQKDAWLVGHCVVSPVEVGERSMALLGSVVTQDMEPNHVYGGAPAKDLTERMGPQFDAPTVEQKLATLRELLERFQRETARFKDRIRVVSSPQELEEGIACFDVADRTYTRSECGAHVAFLKWLLPLAKFTPRGAPPFISARPPTDPVEATG